MKKPLLISTALILIYCTITSAQELTPMAISSSGGFFDSNAGMLSFTTGEMTSIETYSSPGYFLTQGFQQPLDLETSVSLLPEIGLLCGVQPNPSDGYFWLVTKAYAGFLVDWKIVDVLGKEILEGKFKHSGPTTTEPIELTTVPSGTYMISLTIKQYEAQPSAHLVQKIQIIR